jgi:2,4-dienoyl-CoA reductase-like NADH-dependent reductase (Old Yellow Enzyme family)
MGGEVALELKLLAVAVVIGLIQLLWAAGAARAQQDMKWAAGPRDTPMPITGAAARLERAFWNFAETFPFFAAAVLACAEAVGSHRVAVRITPFSVFNGARSEDDSAVYRYLVPALGELGLLYLHVVTAEVAGNQTVVRTDGDDVRDVVGFTRALWPGILMAAGGYDRKKADEEIRSGRADIVAFGRDFIGNPDLPERLAKGHPLTERRPADWYGAAETGYTDYPAFDPLQ